MLYINPRLHFLNIHCQPLAAHTAIFACIPHLNHMKDFNTAALEPGPRNYPVYSSVEETRRLLARQTYAGTGRRIAYGEPLEISVYSGLSLLVKYETCRIADRTQLIGEVRSRMGDRRGLVTVHVFHRTRRWEIRRRIMLYGYTRRPGCGALDFEDRRQTLPLPTSHMLFPWETH